MGGGQKKIDREEGEGERERERGTIVNSYCFYDPRKEMISTFLLKYGAQDYLFYYLIS